MMVMFNNFSEEIVETKKAVGILIKHDGNRKRMWIPKSAIKNDNWKKQRILDVDDKFYDKAFDEIFYN